MSTTSTGSLYSVLEHHAARDESHPFVVDLTDPSGTRTWTYGDALAAVDALSGGLQALGIGPGDRVALRLANSWAFVVTLLATLRIGAIVVPTIRQYSLEELRYALDDSGARAVVFDDEDPTGVRACVPAGVIPIAAKSSSELDESRSLDEIAAWGAKGADVEIDGADDAVIFYTSGTTAQPKGVVLTHAAVLASTLINADGWRLRTDDRAYLVLPLFHCNALFMQLVPLLLAGATTVLDNRFSASRYLALARRHEITLANLTAGAIRSVLAQPERLDDRNHGIRMLTFGLPLHGDEIAAIRDRFGIPAYMAYGLTESSAGGTRTPLHVDPRSGWQSAGVAQPGWQVRVVADDDDRPLPPGEPGEIVLRGPGIMDRYWNRPDETDDALRGGWLRTGDLGWLDEAGYLFFQSRKKDMLKPRGENVAASEIEERLDRHPAVVESGVVGVHDPHHEERIVAFVVVGDEAPDDEALRAHCAASLASFKVPSEFRRIETLPRTSIGKINKGQLRTLAAAEAVQQLGD